jgi:hypothetical protein
VSKAFKSMRPLGKYGVLMAVISLQALTRSAAPTDDDTEIGITSSDMAGAAVAAAAEELPLPCA